MQRTHRFRSIVSLLTVLLVLSAAVALRSPAQTPGQAQAPAIDLIKASPFDRVTLIDDSVLLVEPIFPRPLPAPEVVKKAEAERKKKKEAKADDEIGLRINLHLLEGEQRDFSVDRSAIKKVEYFEDMLLAEGDRAILSRDYSKAFELYLAAHSKDPNWRGVSDRVDKLLLAEGNLALLESDGERGLRILRELYARKPNYPDLGDKLASAYSARVEKSFDSGAYALARRVLHEIEQLTPEHKLVVKARDRFLTRAKLYVDEAAKREGEEKLDLLAEALRIWPKLEGAAEAYSQAFAAVPTLDVAVVDLPNPISPYVRSPADLRSSRLVYLPILASTAQDALEGKVPGQLAASVTTADLGRKLIIELRKDAPWSDGTRNVASIDAARMLSDRADPFSIGYLARWGELLDHVDTPESYRLEIRLTRAALRPEAWLTTPVGPAQAGPDGWVVTSSSRLPIGSGPYRWESTAPGVVRYRAVDSKNPDAKAPKILRVREARLPNNGAVIGALLRGEVSLVEHVSHLDVPVLEQDKEIQVGTFQTPAVHFLAVDGRTPALRNRTLRRAISFAIDRKTILEENLLRTSVDEVNTEADGPFPKESYGNAPGVKPLAPERLLARSLLVAAKKELEMTVLRFTLEYPATPEARIAAPRIAESLREIGLEIDLKEVAESELEISLKRGRRFDLAYRSFVSTEPAIDAGPILCPGFDAPAATNALASVAGTTILPLLLQLEQITDWPTAREIVQRIDRQTRDELPIIPLWQLQNHYAWRTRLAGPGEVTANLYDGIESWEIAPWFARDPW